MQEDENIPKISVIIPTYNRAHLLPRSIKSVLNQTYGDFDQLDYFFGVRDSIDINEINDKIDKMIQSCEYEREKIIGKMNIINRENVFDAVFGCVQKMQKNDIQKAGLKLA